MAGDGVDFERLVMRLLAAIDGNPRYTRVTHDVRIEGPDGRRQIDVLMESDVAGQPIRTVVECKDWKKTLDIKVIDGFHSKMQDINANLGILAARHGFSKNARQKAKRLGIRLLTVDEAPTVLASLGLQVPICLAEVSPKRLLIKAGMVADADYAGADKVDGDTIGGVNLAEHVTRVIGRDLDRPTSGEFDLNPDELRPWTVEIFNSDRPNYRRTVELDHLEVRYRIDVKCWYGPLDLSDDDAHAVHDLETDHVTVVFESGDQDSEQELLYRLGASQIDHLAQIDSFDEAVARAAGRPLLALCLVNDFRSLPDFKGYARNLGTDGDWRPGDFSDPILSG